MKNELNRKIICFYDATTLIYFFKNNADMFRDEKINGFYSPGPRCWLEDAPINTICSQCEPFIIEFDTFAIQIDYYFQSDMWIRIVSHEDFVNGELTRRILGYEEMKKNPQPFERNLFLKSINKPIVEVIVERFSHEFEIEPSSGCVRLNGGDYFASLYLMTEDIGLRLCAEEALSDGYLDYNIVEWADIDQLEDNMDYVYEHIKIG